VWEMSPQLCPASIDQSGRRTQVVALPTVPKPVAGRREQNELAVVVVTPTGTFRVGARL